MSNRGNDQPDYVVDLREGPVDRGPAPTEAGSFPVRPEHGTAGDQANTVQVWAQTQTQAQQV